MGFYVVMIHSISENVTSYFFTHRKIAKDIFQLFVGLEHYAGDRKIADICSRVNCKNAVYLNWDFSPEKAPSRGVISPG